MTRPHEREISCLGICSTVSRFRAAAALVLCLTCATPVHAQVAPDRVIENFSIYLQYGGDYPSLWERLPEKIAHIRATLGSDVLRGGEIYVLPDLNLYFRERGEQELAPRWAQALALPSRRVILLRIPDPHPSTTLTHELSHLAVHEAAGGHHVPRWFLEGFAIYQAEEWGPGRAFSIATAALFGNTLDFSDLDTEFPPHWQTAGLAYAQSFHFVKRLIDEYGEARIEQWLATVATGQDWEEAFRQAFGVPVTREYRRWEKTVRVWYAWVPAVVSFTTIWTGMAVLVLWMRRRVRHRRELQLAAMAAEERDLYGFDPDDELFR